MRRIYLVGSLRNPEVRTIAAALRSDGHEVFDDWHAAGPEADDIWREYEQQCGHSFTEALVRPHAQMVLNFDREHILARDTLILVLPAGRSGHLELGYAAGLGKDTHILMPTDHDRWDIMYGLAGNVWSSLDNMRKWLK